MNSKSYPAGSVLMRPTLDALSRNWPLLLIRGLCACLFGILTLVWPVLTLFVLVLLYGTFALIDGILSIAAAIKGGPSGSKWWLVAMGFLGIVVGAITLFWPQITGFALLLFIAAWAIVTGILQIIGAIGLRKEIEGEWLLIASGLLSVLFGIVIVAVPKAGALGIAFAIGFFAIVYGVLQIAFALRLRKHAEVRI